MWIRSMISCETMEVKKQSGWVTFSLIVAIIALIIDMVWCVAMMLGGNAKFVIFAISALSAFIIIPVFILDFAGFITAFLSKDSRRCLLMWLSGVGLGLLILSGKLFLQGGVNAEKLEKNYLKHSSQMEQAIDYTLSCIQDGNGLEIEFEGSDSVGIFHICIDGIWDGAWNPSRNQVDSLAARIGLSRGNLNELRDLLFKAECHSIRIVKQDGTYDVATLMFRRDMDSAYYYDIHSMNMSESEMETINADDYTRIVYNSRVCFVYGGPAFGDIAFPGKQEYLEGHRRKK